MSSITRADDGTVIIHDLEWSFRLSENGGISVHDGRGSKRSPSTMLRRFSSPTFRANLIEALLSLNKENQNGTD